MMASVEVLSGWFDDGVSMGATHMVVKRDWFDGAAYPVYPKSHADAQDVVTASEDRRGHTTVADSVLEVYNLRKPKAPQMVPFKRVWDLEDTPPPAA